MSTSSSPAGSASARTRLLPGGRQRSTRQGDAVDTVLRDSDGFRTAQDLYAELRGRGDAIGLTTVYRHLKMLLDSGEVDVVHRPDGEAQYRLCGPRGTTPEVVPPEHHHHLVCRVCGRAVEVAGPEVEAWADEVAAANGYTEISHTLEVFGLCPEHSAPASTRSRRTPPRATPTPRRRPARDAR